MSFTQKQCTSEYNGCFKKCAPGDKLIEKFFVHAEDGNSKVFNKGYDHVVGHGWDVKSSAKDDVTPLHHAAGTGDFEIVKLLVDAGAVVWVEDHHGQKGWFFIPDEQNGTPVDYARDAGRTDIVEYLENLPPPTGAD